MYQKCFAEYDISEEDLKIKIYSTLKSLSPLAPEEFSSNIFEHIELNLSTEDFLRNLASLIPAIKDLDKNLNLLTTNARLRMMAINLDIILYTKRLEHILPKLIHIMFSSQLLGFRYIIASIIIEKMLGEKLQYDSDTIIQNLMNLPNAEDQMGNKFTEIMLAEEEISRIIHNEKTKLFFINVIDNFEAFVQDYIHQNLPNVVYEMFTRIFSEAVITHINIVDEALSLKNPIKSEDRNDLIKVLSRIVRRGTSFRLGVQRGGKREKKGFMWTEQNKISFYEQVVQLPKINDKPMWEYAFNELTEKNFNFYIEEYLKTRIEFKTVPKKLFVEAIKTWKKYKDDLINIKPQDKPRAFEFQHALHILEYPEITFSTSVKYFTEGKKLSKLNK